jgi:DNA repair protein RadA/Sms
LEVDQALVDSAEDCAGVPVGVVAVFAVEADGFFVLGLSAAGPTLATIRRPHGPLPVNCNGLVPYRNSRNSAHNRSQSVISPPSPPIQESGAAWRRKLNRRQNPLVARRSEHRFGLSLPVWYNARTMAKTVTRFVCRECGYETPKWLGKCPSCEAWGTLDEITVTASVSSSVRAARMQSNGSPAAGWKSPQRLIDVASPAQEGRYSTGIGEFDRVLGGGIVRGALILIGGDPGIGKSTLLTQMAGHLAHSTGTVLYVSGEESAPQIKRRAERLGIRDDARLLLHNETDVTLIRAGAQTGSDDVRFIIVDSIQTMRHPEVESSPGSVWQVRACTAALAELAKGEGIPIFLVGHVTKEGSLAGPKVLEHMVDTVISFEGDRHSMYRILRASKNRFGSTDEMGIFEMHEEGLTEVSNPSELLLAERPLHAVGSAVTAVMEGSRPLLVEVQALVAPSPLTNPRRSVTGMDQGRVHMILAVLEKRAGIGLYNQDVFINIAGGVRVGEPAADLAVALAAASHVQNLPVEPRTIAIGEIGLAGEVRAVPNIEKRLREASRLGFERALIAARNRQAIKNIGRDFAGIKILAVDTVKHAILEGLAEV